MTLRNLIGGSLAAALFAAAVVIATMALASPADGSAACGRGRDGRPVHCRCLPDGEPIDPRYWDRVSQMRSTRVSER